MGPAAPGCRARAGNRGRSCLLLPHALDTSMLHLPLLLHCRDAAAAAAAVRRPAAVAAAPQQRWSRQGMTLLHGATDHACDAGQHTVIFLQGDTEVQHLAPDKHDTHTHSSAGNRHDSEVHLVLSATCSRRLMRRMGGTPAVVTLQRALHLALHGSHIGQHTCSTCHLPCLHDTRWQCLHDSDQAKVHTGNTAEPLSTPLAPGTQHYLCFRELHPLGHMSPVAGRCRLDPHGGEVQC